MNLGTQKWKKARPNFAGVRDDAGRCGVACTRACSSQGMGMQQPRPAQQPPMGILPSPGHAAAKAKAAPMGRQPRPWHAAAKALACTLTEGQWQHGEGVACPVLGMPRPWHALGTPRRPWQHLGGVLQPSLDSLFGHLLLFPP